MSGPPYPAAPMAFDFWSTIVGQYANSPTLTQLIADFSECVSPAADLDAFYDLVWNVDTAQGYGLDVWGRIVNVSRVLQIPSGVQSFGFHEAAGATIGTFNEASFFSGVPVTSNFVLADDAYRTLIFAKALANISDGSVPSINQLLLNLFPGRGKCYVTDPGGMALAYVFDSFSPPLQPVELAIIQQSGALPKPVGVVASVVQI